MHASPPSPVLPPLAAGSRPSRRAPRSRPSARRPRGSGRATAGTGRAARRQRRRRSFADPLRVPELPAAGLPSAGPLGKPSGWLSGPRQQLDEDGRAGGRSWAAVVPRRRCCRATTSARPSSAHVLGVHAGPGTPQPQLAGLCVRGAPRPVLGCCAPPQNRPRQQRWDGGTHSERYNRGQWKSEPADPYAPQAGPGGTVWPVDASPDPTSDGFRRDRGAPSTCARGVGEYGASGYVAGLRRRRRIVPLCPERASLSTAEGGRSSSAASCRRSSSLARTLIRSQGGGGGRGGVGGGRGSLSLGRRRGRLPRLRERAAA